MADAKISDIAATGGLLATHLMETESAGGTSERATLAQLLALILSDATSSAALAARRHPGAISGQWYLPDSTQLAGGAATTINSARFIPWIAPFSATIATLGVRITTGGSTNLQLAIYANQQKAGEGSRPSTELAKTGNIVNTATGPTPGNLLASLAVTAGTTYWLGMNSGDSTMVCTAYSSARGMIPWLAGTATQGAAFTATPATACYVSTPLTLGTWGDLTSATWTEGSNGAHAAIQLKVA